MLNRRSILLASIAAAASRFAQSLPASELTETVSIDVDASPLTNALNSFAELFESGCEVSQGLLDLLETPNQLFRFETDRMSAGAYKTIVRLHPSDAFLAAVAACRARNIKQMPVDFQVVHYGSASVDGAGFRVYQL